MFNCLNNLRKLLNNCCMITNSCKNSHQLMLIIFVYFHLSSSLVLYIRLINQFLHCEEFLKTQQISHVKSDKKLKLSNTCICVVFVVLTKDLFLICFLNKIENHPSSNQPKMYYLWLLCFQIFVDWYSNWFLWTMVFAFGFQAISLWSFNS